MPPLSPEECEALLKELYSMGCTLEVAEYGPPINEAEYRVYDALGNYLGGGLWRSDALEQAYFALTGRRWRGD